jgi:hypothetical protein
MAAKAALIALALASGLVSAQPIHRSAASRAAFKREQPCPSTGLRRGACPGWVIDHKQALCVGGPDAPENMAWMTVAAAKAKDRWECKPGWKTRLRDCEASGECFSDLRMK